MTAKGVSRRRLQRLLGVAIFLVLATLGGMLWLNLSPPDLLPGLIEKLPEDVDLGLDRVHYSQNENGRKRWELDAERAAYQRKEEELALTGVELTFYEAGSFGELRLSAASGILRQQEETISLTGDVRIEAASGEQFRSESLEYDFARRMIETDAPIQMRTRQLELTGVGMSLDLVGGKMRVMQKVHALLDERSFQGETQ